MRLSWASILAPSLQTYLGHTSLNRQQDKDKLHFLGQLNRHVERKCIARKIRTSVFVQKYIISCWFSICRIILGSHDRNLIRSPYYAALRIHPLCLNREVWYFPRGSWTCLLQHGTRSPAGFLPAASRAVNSGDADDLPQEHMRAFMVDVDRIVHDQLPARHI